MMCFEIIALPSVNPGGICKLTSNQQNWRFVGMELHLTGHILTIEMGIPQAPFACNGRKAIGVQWNASRDNIW